MFNPKSAENTRRMKNAFSNTENVLSKYGKDNLKVVGHSQGGYVSSSVAQKLDLEGHHYNPAISVRQINSEGGVRGVKKNTKPRFRVFSVLATTPFSQGIWPYDKANF